MATRHIVTIFGGTGFIGRYIVKRLAERGVTVRVATRNIERAKFLKPMGYLGQIVPVHCDVRDDAAVAEVVAGAETVINLIGILYERGANTFAEVHVNTARRIAAAAKAAGVNRLLHMSALGADAASDAAYASSKAAGETAVHDAFPGATVMRPSVVFGPEDSFLNLFAVMARLSPILPVVGAPMPRYDLSKGLDLYGDGGPKFQPIYVGDVADAFIAALDDPGSAGKTYELGGPRVYSFKELLDYLLRVTRQRAWLMPVPFWAARIQAFFLQYLPKPPLTPDQVKLLARDNVVDPGALTLADLGIEPNSLEAIAPTYLKRHRPPRKNGEFNRFA